MSTTETARPAIPPRRERGFGSSSTLGGRKQPAAIRIWAGVGAAILVFQTYVIVAWVTGPHFQRVPPGPSEPPGWMQTIQTGYRFVGFALFAGCVYWLLIRPWRRERRVTTDGLLFLAFLNLVFQDPLSAYWNNWFTWNSWNWNMGSWVAEIPGWSSFAAPGQMIPEPLLLAPLLYAYVFAIVSALGCWVMRRVKARWPEVSNRRLVAVCWVAMVIFDFVVEAGIWIPMGIYTYAGAPLSIFSEHYYKFPLPVAFFTGSLFCAVACLRYFTNDKGETFVERGASTLRVSPAKNTAIRGLALLAGANTLMFVLFNVPFALIGTHATAWPEDIQKRSYLVDGLCGEGTDRACPAPGVPLYRGNKTIHVDPDGRLVIPEGVTVPELVPFDRGQPGGND